MLLLPKFTARQHSMLTIVTGCLGLGVSAATVIRMDLHMSLQTPLLLAAKVGPVLAVPWLWHLRRWPGVHWVEVTAFTLAVAVGQRVTAVDVGGALLVIPVIGVLHRNRGLTVYAAVLGAFTNTVLLWFDPQWRGSRFFGLQATATAILLGTLASIYTWLIRLAEQAERSLVQAQLTEQMAMQWAASIEARDQYTGGHVERVTWYAMEMAPLVGNLGMDLREFRLASVLHDVGKIAVPDQILNKAGPLTPEERAIMEAHAANGHALVVRTNVPPAVAAVVRLHHERWDGKGYPDGLSGTEIPVAARLLAVADAFDAMTSDRPYRAALDPLEARRRIVDGAGSQFDPAMVAVFEQVFERWLSLHKGVRKPGA